MIMRAKIVAVPFVDVFCIVIFLSCPTPHGLAWVSGDLSVWPMRELFILTI